MLVIQMPDSEERKNKARRRKRRVTGYIIAGLIIMAAIILSPNRVWLSASVGVELWWLWAISTDQVLSGDGYVESQPQRPFGPVARLTVTPDGDQGTVPVHDPVQVQGVRRAHDLRWRYIFLPRFRPQLRHPESAQGVISDSLPVVLRPNHRLRGLGYLAALEDVTVRLGAVVHHHRGGVFPGVSPADTTGAAFQQPPEFP